MKITRKQLRQIIKESIAEASDAQKEGNKKSDLSVAVGFAAGSGAGLGASAALGLSGAAGPVAGLVAMIALGVIAYDTMKDVDEASRKATAQRMNDILKRTMSISLKKLKAAGMPQESVKIAYNAIMKGSAENIMEQIKAGNIDIDLNDLQKVHNDMKSSASEEYVDQKAIEKMLEDIRNFMVN